MPDGQTLKDRATQLLIKYKSGALVTQCHACDIYMDGRTESGKQGSVLLDQKPQYGIAMSLKKDEIIAPTKGNGGGGIIENCDKGAPPLNGFPERTYTEAASLFNFTMDTFL